jgi:hypothetical protein
MPRRLNFTGRKKISLSDTRVRLIRSGESLRFDAELNLDHYSFNPQARVHVEAYRGLSALWKRFDFGKVGLRSQPDDRSLDEFEHPEGILFRVKVSSEGERLGCLLGEADGIRPQLPNENQIPSIPLIDVDRGPLGGEPWIVTFPDGAAGMPHLIINDRIEDWNSRARDPLFRSLVLPAVMRQILTQIFIIDGDLGIEDDPDDWRQRWIRFAEGLPNIGGPPPPLDSGEDLGNRDDLTGWITDSVSAFSVRAGLMNTLLTIWNPENQT